MAKDKDWKVVYVDPWGKRDNAVTFHAAFYGGRDARKLALKWRSETAHPEIFLVVPVGQRPREGKR